MAGPRPLARMTPTIAGKALGRRGLALGQLIADWSAIVGADLAERSVPHKLSFSRGQRADAVLHVRAAGACAVEMQHDEPRILERINTFFGYRAVVRLKLVQAPLAARKASGGGARALGPDEDAAIAAATAPVEDEALRAALARFARSVLAHGGS